MDIVDYDKVLACAKAGEQLCNCAPDRAAEKPTHEQCIDSGFARESNYPFGPDDADGGAAATSLNAVAGMAYEGEIEVFGNSIGVDTAVAGRKVKITSFAGDDNRRNSAPRHELLVAPIGLRSR